ncbi:hypothetical protein [Limosilactobacillus caecicola]|uniref:hypothetical protein n=1 Tax=Limosilactobacillus caecicola TaxID=2941332 RepID=UPI00203CED8B|nr:hypothetical protein [Limosilactobacillus caecicola]
MMNRTFMLGYLQGVIEAAPAALSVAKTDAFAAAMVIQHLRHAGLDAMSIHDFLIDDAHFSPRLAARYINFTADQLETVQAQILQQAQ